MRENNNEDNIETGNNINLLNDSSAIEKLTEVNREATVYKIDDMELSPDVNNAKKLLGQDLINEVDNYNLIDYEQEHLKTRYRGFFTQMTPQEIMMHQTSLLKKPLTNLPSSLNEMAIQLLRPFIACELLKRGVANAHKQADKIIDRYDDVVFDIVEEIISKHPVLLNRAPTLHRLGIQAFQPILVDGRAIRLHPLVCTGFNADFDGDQMAVHVPLSKAAQEEALHLMLASNNILGPKDGKPIVTPSQDMVIGNYYLTLESTKEDFLRIAKDLHARKDEEEAERYELYAASEGKVFKDVDDVIRAYQTKQIHLHNRIALLGSAMMKKDFTEEQNKSYLITSVGKIIFNLIFPSDFPYLNEVSSASLRGDQEVISTYFAPRGTNIPEFIAARPVLKPFTKKHLGLIINEIFQRYDRQGNPKTSAVLDKIKDQGFHYSTVAGLTVSLSDIHAVKGKEEILKDYT